MGNEKRTHHEPDGTMKARRERARRYLIDRGLAPTSTSRVQGERGSWVIFNCGCAIPRAYPLRRDIQACRQHALPLGELESPAALRRAELEAGLRTVFAPRGGAKC